MTQRKVNKMANTYFYMRISTKESADKQSFQRQKKSLERYANENELSLFTYHIVNIKQVKRSKLV